MNIEHYCDGNQLFDGHYKLLNPLSTDGGTADVWLAIDVNTIDTNAPQQEDEEDSGMLVAIKIYRPKNFLDIEGEQRFRDEFKIVYECRHANLLQPTSFSIFEGIPYLVLPFCKNGSSEQLIGQFTEENDMWKFILDVASGLDRLHTNMPQIIHQDIKPANILIDNTMNYAITDFGISSRRGGVHGYYYDDGHSGTLAYMAPERFAENAEPMTQSDIWAFGATLCEIFTGHVPFGENGGKVQTDNPQAVADLTGVPSGIQKLITACLNSNPAKRPTARQIIEAARAKEYPKKSRVPLYAALLLLLALLVGGTVWFLATHEEKPTIIVEAEKRPPVEQVFKDALAKLGSEQPETMKAGLALMDSLAATNYIPAIYEMAFTYGWYSDPVSVKRKQMLGIEIDESYLPRQDRYSNKAVALFTRIMELRDSAYADINANATYRLACYYVMPNNIYKPNYEKGKRFLIRSKEWATLAKDDDLLEKIENGLASFE